MRMLFRLLALCCLLAGISLAQAPAAKSTSQGPSDVPKYIPSFDEKALDKTADPCVDFYQYSCGGWIKNNPIPADQPGWSVYGKLQEDNERFLWGILQGLAEPPHQHTASQRLIGDYFAACMDETTVQQRGA